MSEPHLRRFYGTAIEQEFCKGLRFMKDAAEFVLGRELTAEESWGLDEWLADCYAKRSHENELLKSIQGNEQPAREGA